MDNTFIYNPDYVFFKVKKFGQKVSTLLVWTINQDLIKVVKVFTLTNERTCW